MNKHLMNRIYNLIDRNSELTRSIADLYTKKTDIKTSPRDVANSVTPDIKVSLKPLENKINNISRDYKVIKLALEEIMSRMGDVITEIV